MRLHEETHFANMGETEVPPDLHAHASTFVAQIDLLRLFHAFWLPRIVVERSKKKSPTLRPGS